MMMKVPGPAGTTLRMIQMPMGPIQMKGAGFFDDVLSGVRMVTNPLKQVASLVPHPYAQLGAKGLDLIGLGKTKRGRIHW